jgi:lia operon protein LiaF
MARSRPSRYFVAIALIVVGVVFLLGNLGLVALNWSIVWPALLILFGVWLVWRAFLPASSQASQVSYGFGDYAPDLSGKEIRRETFSHGLGDFDLDLTHATIPDGESVVRASLGFGDLKVIVPNGLALKIHASAGFGELELFAQKTEGIGPNLKYRSDDYATASRKVDLDASVGVGQVRVVKTT